MVKASKMVAYVLMCPKFSWENVNYQAIIRAKKHHVNRVLNYRSRLSGKGRSVVSNLLALT